ncbi:hypothetical protein C2E23DRAFT_890777 [Lenzites betulinus]|nr:hypothetical protein C2E23DRAFT_890777 [Lenzites betulinus]
MSTPSSPHELSTYRNYSVSTGGLRNAMAPPIDNRVRDIVDEELDAANISWLSKLQICPQGTRHKPVRSYGGTNFTNTGMVFELCLGPEKCHHHKKPMLAHQSLAARLAIWVRVASLDPPANHSEVLKAEAIIMRENMRDELNVARSNPQFSSPSVNRPTRASLPLSSPATAAWRRSNTSQSRSASRSSMASSHRSTLGRPHNPVCEVVVYVYLPGRRNPLVIHAEGTPRDDVVEFKFSQPTVLRDLQIDLKDPHKPVYTMWHQTAQIWSMYPKAHHSVFLAPGERVLYREMYVSETANLEHYKALLLPPLVGDDTRPTEPASALSYAPRPLKRGSPESSSDDDNSSSSFSMLHLLPFADFGSAVSSSVNKHSPTPEPFVSRAHDKRRAASPVDRTAIRSRKRVRLDAEAAATLIEIPETKPRIRPFDVDRAKGKGKAKAKGPRTGGADVIEISD